MENQQARRKYAESLEELGYIRSEPVFRAFTEVPREKYAGPPPWTIFCPDKDFAEKETSDPQYLYTSGLLALDREKGINNGSPIINAIGIEALAIRPGDHVYQIGTGGGYYTAILAEIVGSTGKVTGLEIDAQQFLQAKQNLQPYANIEIIHTDASTFEMQPTNAIISHAGASYPQSNWLRALQHNSVLVFPLTYSLRGSEETIGKYLRIKLIDSKFQSEVLCDCAFYPCIGTRDDKWSRIFQQLAKQCTNKELAQRIDGFLNNAQAV